MNLAGGVALVEEAKQQEELGICHAVAEDLEDGASGTIQGEPVEAENDEAEVAERGEGKQTPEVTLGEGEASAIKDADDGQSDEVRSSGVSLDRKEPDVEPQHGVETELAGDD